MLSNNDFGEGWEELTRRRLVILAFLFCGLFASLEVKLFELVGVHKPSKVSPSVEVLMLVGLIFVSPLISLLFTRLMNMITDRTAEAVAKHEHRQELAIAILMLQDRTKKNLLGKSSLVTVSFLSVMLWLIGAANQSAMLVSLFAAFCFVASIADDVLLARRIKDGTFAESESDARDLLSFICHTDRPCFDDFTGRPIVPNDRVPDLGNAIDGVPGLPN
jgi:hypothetical protein